LIAPARGATLEAMARGLNKVMLIGNLGKDAETRYTKSGTPVTSFPVATTRRIKDGQSGEWRDETDWHDVVVWKAENVAGYLLKGTQVYVEGRLQTRSWEGQDGQKKYRTEIVADGSHGVMLLSGGGGQKPSAGPGGGGSQRPEPASDDMGVGDDDVPF
jgi:single-strand DNA-binding protein